MRPPIASALSLAPAPAEQDRSSLALSVSLVLLFWWAATGFTFAMQASQAAVVVSLVATTLLAAIGATLVVRSRNDDSARGARAAFLGSALLWWWCAAVFYAGWGVRLAGSVSERTPPAARSLSLAFDAIAATWRADALGLLVLAFVLTAVRRCPNRVAFWSLVIFWGTLQTAKLNVFFGVRNAGAELLPPHLAGLGTYFGPPQNSLLLPVTVLALGALFLHLGNRARRATSTFGRHADGILAMLVGLAVLEHAVLGASAVLPLWNLFLSQNT